MKAAHLDRAARAAMVDGAIVLAGLLFVLLILSGCTSAAVANEWQPCWDEPDATMVITADGYVINCVTDPNATAPRPKAKKPFGAVTE